MPRVYPFGRLRSEATIEYIKSKFGLVGTRLLDLGCGTGKLCVACAEVGMHATGVDFSAGMLAEAEKHRSAMRGDAAQRVTFAQQSVLDTGLPAESFDVVTALGLIEYLDDLGVRRFFAEAHRLLRPGGALVIEARNRLFNLGSLNRYTEVEIGGNAASALLGEIMAAGSLVSADRLRSFGARLAVAARQLELALAADVKDKESGVAPTDVTVHVENPLPRLQHTPEQLRGLGTEAGLALVRALGLHPHPLPSEVEKSYPRFYNCLALAFEELADTPLMLSRCSSILCCFDRS